jgi:ankyrin repeat protein
LVAILLLAVQPGFKIDPTDENGRTPLSWASQGGLVVAADWLLKEGSDPNHLDNDGWGPLHYAAADGHAEVVRALLSSGANPCRRLPSGHFPSDLARHFSKRTDACLILEAAESSCQGQDTSPD